MRSTLFEIPLYFFRLPVHGYGLMVLLGFLAGVGITVRRARVLGFAPGEVLEEGVNMDILRPGKNRRGMNPFEIGRVQGRRATRAIPAGDGIREGDFA